MAVLTESPKWPRVIGEYETLEAMHEGASIGRYGDGEYNLCMGRKNVSQQYEPKLRDELLEIIGQGSQRDFLVGIPPLDQLARIPEGKKRNFWSQQRVSRYHLHKPDATYHSSFITRSDNAPWIDKPDYWERLVDLWRDQDITLVIGSERSLCSRNTDEAKSVTYVEGEYSSTYRIIDKLQADIVKAGNNRVILCLGATATVLAYRLRKDFHCLDLGHVGLKGMFKKGRGLI